MTLDRQSGGRHFTSVLNYSLIILILVFGGIAGSQLLPYAGILLALGTLLLRYTILRAGRHGTPV